MPLPVIYTVKNVDTTNTLLNEPELYPPNCIEEAEPVKYNTMITFPFKYAAWLPDEIIITF
jgi:hypothetical protein